MTVARSKRLSNAQAERRGLSQRSGGKTVGWSALLGTVN